MKKERTNLQRKILEREIQKEAKTAERSELEEFYTEQTLNEETDERVSSYWTLISVILIFITIMLGAALWGTHDLNKQSEEVNDILAQRICENENQDMKYIVHGSKEITIKCEDARMKIEIKR